MNPRVLDLQEPLVSTRKRFCYFLFSPGDADIITRLSLFVGYFVAIFFSELFVNFACSAGRSLTSFVEFWICGLTKAVGLVHRSA